jgi:hypothetical protein
LAVLGLAGGEPAGRVAFHRVEPLTLDYVRSADPAWLESLGARIKILALVPLVRAATLDLVTDPDTYALEERLLLPLAAAHPDAAESLVEQRLLRGRVDQVPQLLPGRDDPEALALRTWLHCLQGDYAQAIMCCETGQQITRKLTRKRNVYTPGIPGVLYMMALLRRGERADFERVQQQVSTCLRAAVTDPVEHVYRVLGDLPAVLAGQRRIAEAGWPCASLSRCFPRPFRRNCATTRRKATFA